MCEISIQCFGKYSPEKEKLLQIFQCVTVCIDKKTRERFLLRDFLFIAMNQILTKIFVIVQSERWPFLLIIAMSCQDECLAFQILTTFYGGCHLKIEWGRFSRNNGYYPTFHDNLPYFHRSCLLVCLQWKNSLRGG